MMAGDALAEAARQRLAGVKALNGCYDGPPQRATVPFAIVEAGTESDWGHKSGAGREVRLTLTLRDSGERSVRLRALVAEAEAALAGIGGVVGGWRIVSFVFLRSRLLADGERGWAALIDYRGRMLAE